MRSMTGYGKSSVVNNGIEITVEIRSVNNRYLDLNIRVPRENNSIELERFIHDKIKGVVSRGKVSVNVNISDKHSTGSFTDASLARYKQRLDFLEKLKTELNIKQTFTLEHIFAFPEIIENAETGLTEEERLSLMRPALQKALEDFLKMCETEGRYLSNDISPRLELIKKYTGFVEERGRKNIRFEFDKLLKNVFDLVDQQKIDKSRLEQEIAIISDKVDITEECVRMRSHLYLFEQTLKKQDDIGKKLIFILQEMLREANTMNSKTTDIEISHKVIQIKEEIEKLREQAQNIE